MATRDKLRRAEIGNAEIVVLLTYEDIGGLDIPVNYSHIGEMAQGLKCSLDHF